MDVSIIIPSYNRCSLLKRAIQSVLDDASADGGRAHVEVIVIDDGSTDDSVDMVRSFGLPVRVIAQVRAGANVARNRGLAEAAGKYIRFLDSDDWLEKGVTWQQMTALVESGADLCYGDWRDAFEHPTGSNDTVLSMGPVADPVETLLGSKWAAPFCYLYKSEAARSAGGWQVDLPAAQDFDFILRIAMQGCRFAHVPVVIGHYYHHTQSRVSRDNPAGWCAAVRRVLSEAVVRLDRDNSWTPGRRKAVARSLLALAKTYYQFGPEKARDCFRLMQQVAPDFKAPGLLYRNLVKILGYSNAEAVLEVRRRWRRRRIQSPSGRV